MFRLHFDLLLRSHFDLHIVLHFRVRIHSCRSKHQTHEQGRARLKAREDEQSSRKHGQQLQTLRRLLRRA